MDFRKLLQEERRRARESAAQKAPATEEAPPIDSGESRADASESARSDAPLETDDAPLSCWRARTPLELERFRVPGIESVFYVPEWLSQEEEDAILARVNGAAPAAWVQLKRRRLQMYGGEVKAPFHPEPLPRWLAQIADALVQSGVFRRELAPNHTLINEYGVGEGILPHEDGPSYLPLVAIASTGADASVSFAPHRKHAAANAAGDSVRFPVRRRSLLLFTGEAYTRYLHSIDGVESDKRVSLTIRHVHTAAAPF